MDRTTIEYAAVPNGRVGYGWIPMLWINGRRTGHTYYAQGADRETALTAALVLARDEADRYVGDWNIVVQERITDA